MGEGVAFLSCPFTAGQSQMASGGELEEGLG